MGAAAPAADLLVSRDRKTASSASLLPLMGLSAEPQSLHDLHGLDDRIEAKDLAGLIDDIASMPVSGRPFARLLHATGADRLFRAEGRIVDPAIGRAS